MFGRETPFNMITWQFRLLNYKLARLYKTTDTHNFNIKLTFFITIVAIFSVDWHEVWYSVIAERSCLHEIRVAATRQIQQCVWYVSMIVIDMQRVLLAEYAGVSVNKVVRLFYQIASRKERTASAKVKGYCIVKHVVAATFTVTQKRYDGRRCRWIVKEADGRMSR